MLTTFPDDSYVKDALNCGAYGYILKNMRSEDLISSIRAISRGAALFSPDILKKLIHREDTKAEGSTDYNEYKDILNRLGNREKEILKLVAKGYSNKEIANAIFISEPTVRNYISSIYAKVGTKDRLQVMSFGQKANA